MSRRILVTLIGLALATQTASAQKGGHGGGGHGGGGHGGGIHGGGGHYYGGHGGYYHGGYGGRYYGGYGFYPFFGLGIGYPYYSGYGLGYPSYSGFGLGGYGQGYYGYGGWPYSWDYDYPQSSGYYSVAPAVYPDTTIVPYTPATPELVPAAGIVPARSSAPATVRLTGPAGTRVWFDGKAVQANSGQWTYTTPTLEPGKTYTVNARARWSQDGQDQTIDLPLGVVAGDDLTVDLTRIR